MASLGLGRFPRNATAAGSGNESRTNRDPEGSYHLQAGTRCVAIDCHDEPDHTVAWPNQSAAFRTGASTQSEPDAEPGAASESELEPERLSRRCRRCRLL